MDASFYQSLLLTLFNSLWQSAILFGLFKLFVGRNMEMSALGRRNGLLLLLATQLSISVVSLFVGAGFITTAISTVSFSSFSLASFPNLFFLLTALYAGGVAFYFLQMMIALQSTNKELLKKSAESPGSLQSAVTALLARLQIKKHINIKVHKGIKTPMVVGILKPVILFPFSLLTTLSTEQIECLLVHELSHIKNNDTVYNLFLVIAESLFFFNPFTAAICKEIRKEREQACDEAVLSYNYPAVVYAEALLQTASSNHSSILRLAAAGNHDLADRIALFTKQQEEKRTDRKPILLLLGSSVLLFVMIAFFGSISIQKSSHLDLVKEDLPIFIIKSLPEYTKEVKSVEVDKKLSIVSNAAPTKIASVAELPANKPAPIAVISDMKSKIIKPVATPEATTPTDNNLENRYAYVANFNEEKNKVDEQTEVMIEEIEEAGRKETVAYRIIRGENGEVTLIPIVQMQERTKKDKGAKDSTTTGDMLESKKQIEIYPTVQ